MTKPRTSSPPKDVLQRPPDASGRDAYDAALAFGWSPAQVATSVLASDEYSLHLVQDLYGLFLHRAAEVPGQEAWESLLRDCCLVPAGR